MNRKCVFRDGRIISDSEKPYIICEVNSSHNGKMDVAKEMILEAKKSGCDCVKFQSWSTESLYSQTYYKQNPIAKRFVKTFSLSLDEQLELAQFCKDNEIAFSSTPYSKEEVDFLVDKCEVPFIKIASMELNNDDFLRYIAKKNCPIVLSSGMGEIDELKHAVEVILSEGNDQICLLHCISIYPAEPDTIHLNNILGLRELFPEIPIGFSDHSLGTDLSIAAIAMGARIIEKHFTLDKNRVGMDNNMAIEPEEMTRLVDGCNRVYEALGSKERVVSEAEYEQRKNMRRSLILTRNMSAGEIITEADLDAKRPGTGIAPNEKYRVIGKKLVNDVNADELLNESDFI